MASIGFGHDGAAPRVVRDRESYSERFRRFVRFGLVGMSGVLVNEAALALLVNILHVNYLVGAVFATQCSTAWNFALVEWWAFEGVGSRSGRMRRFLMFWAVNMAALALRGPILALLTSVFHIHYLISNLLSLGVLVVVRFAVADSLIWGKSSTVERPVAAEQADGVLADFLREVADDLGWAVNPVAEAAHVLGPRPADVPSVDLTTAGELDAEPRADKRPDGAGQPDRPRFGSVFPPTILSETGANGSPSAPRALRGRRMHGRGRDG